MNLSTYYIVFFLLFLNSSINAQNGLKAEYYNGINFDTLVGERHVGNINQSWYEIPPVKGLDPHYCSIRWTGKLIANETREYLFSARVDDGIRVWINNRMIMDQWELHDQGVFEGKMVLQAGQEYELKVEYFNALNEGEIHLLWDIPYEDQSWYQYFFEDTNIPIPVDNLLFPEEEVVTIEPPAIEEKPVIVAKKKTPPKKQVIEKPVEKLTEKPIVAQVVEKKSITPEEAEKFIPNNISFQRGKTIMLGSSIKELEIFSQFMKENPRVKVMIEGHTDPVGDAKLNLQLSVDRAAKVATFLVDKGINEDRIQSKGYGGTRPLVIPKEGEYYPANRRVVFILSGL